MRLVLAQVVFLLVFLTAGSLEAQLGRPVDSELTFEEANPLSLRIGDRVRLRDERFAVMPIDGRVAIVEPYGFGYTVTGDSRIYMLPYVDVDTIDVRRRLPRKAAVDAAIWGAFLGGAVGAISGPFAAKSLTIDTGPAMAAFGAGGGIMGGLIGAATGALLKPARWYRHILR